LVPLSDQAYRLDEHLMAALVLWCEFRWIVITDSVPS